MNDSNHRRVVVTGLGLVTPLGTGVEKNWEAIIAGRSGITPINRFPNVESMASRIAGQIPDFRGEDFIEPKEMKKMDLFIQYSLVASECFNCSDVKSRKSAGTFTLSKSGVSNCSLNILPL